MNQNQVVGFYRDSLLSADTEPADDRSGRTRPVFEDEKYQPKEKLVQYRNTVIEQRTSEMLNTFFLPSVLEFGTTKIKQFLDNANRIFTHEEHNIHT